MNPDAANLTLTGPAPTLAFFVRVPAGGIEVSGVAPAVAAGSVRFVYPATRNVRVAGRAPTALQYNEAVVNFTRVGIRPALEGRVRINRG